MCGARRGSVKATEEFTLRRVACMAVDRRHGGDERMQGTGGVVFGVAGLLALIAFLPRLAARLRLPYTVLLAALGCTLGAVISLSGIMLDPLPGPVLQDFFQELRGFNISADILLWVFLPILLFDTATKLDGRELLDDVGPILILAVVAVLMTTAAAGVAVWWVSSAGLTACLLGKFPIWRSSTIFMLAGVASIFIDIVAAIFIPLLR